MAMTIEQAMRHAAKVIELYDDALADSCEMATSTDSAEVLNALADYYAAHLAQPAQAVDVDYVPGELDRTAPERVWLQIDTSASNNVRNEVWPGADGVTWQDESIGGLEIQYVRADLVPRALSGEKAGPVGDGLMFPEWVIESLDVLDAETQRLYLDPTDGNKVGLNERCAITFFRRFIADPEGACRMYGALPASPTPDKEGA